MPIGFATVLTWTAIQITRTGLRDHGGRGELKISVVARNNAVIKKLVLQAKHEYEQDMEHRGRY